MILIKIEHLRPVPPSLPENEVVTTTHIVGRTVGSAFDSFALDPREDSIWKITVVDTNTKVSND